MNFLYNFGSAVLMSLFAQKQLQAMHLMIEEKNIPVEKRDHLYQQVIALEELSGNSEFKKRYKRASSARKSAIIIAISVLFVAASLFAGSRLTYFSGNLDALNVWIKEDFLRFAYIIGGLAGGILISLIGLVFYIRSQFNFLNGDGIYQVWMSMISRWFPELAQDIPLNGTSVDEVANLVVRNLSRDRGQGVTIV